MKKILLSVLIAIQLSVPVSFAATSNIGQVQTAELIFDSGFDAGQVETLSLEEMKSTEGEFIHLPYWGYLAAITAIDLGLMGAFWAVYLPSIQQIGTTAYQSYDR